MFNPVLFELGGVLLAGQYLLGQHRWSADVTLLEAVLVCRPPASGTLTLALEIGGVLRGDVFTVAASPSSEVKQTLTLDRAVPAGSSVRWKATAYAGPDQDAASALALTLTLS